MRNRKQYARLRALAGGIAVPASYYEGWRHEPLPAPENILMFVRRSMAELRDGTYEPHFHHRWVLIAALDGEAPVVVDGRSHPLGPGRFLVVPPLRLHRYERAPERGLLWLFITFELPGHAAASEPVSGTVTRSGIESLERMLQIWRQRPRRTEASARLAVEFALLLGGMLAGGKPRPHGVPGRNTGLLERINRWAADPASGPATLDSLARHAGLSESRLRAWFRARYGLSLGRYIREARCRRAAQSLMEGEGTVAEVAARHGFSSAFSFSRTFKQVMGRAPSLLRKRS